MAELHASLYEGLADAVMRWESLTPAQRAEEEARSAAQAAKIGAEMAEKARAHEQALRLLEPVIAGLVKAGLIDRKQADELRNDASMGGTVPNGATEKAHQANENPPPIVRGKIYWKDGESTRWLEYAPIPCIASCCENFGHTAETYIGVTKSEVIVWSYKWPMKHPKVLRAPREAAS
jgi:hypothetical protein